MGNSCVTVKSNDPEFYRDGQPTFKWRIDGFSSLLAKDQGWTCSSVFEIRGHSWYLQLNPRDTKSDDTDEYVSLRLELSQTSVRSDTVVETYFKFLIYDQSYGKHHQQNVNHKFQPTSTSSGTSCLIPLTKLKEQSSGFLVNNCCVFGVEFGAVVTVKANGASETLFVQKVNSICSDPKVYTWNIDDFFALKSPNNSPEFELCGHKWFITIYPSGADKDENYLSLFLGMKTPDTQNAKLVELSIMIKDQETGKHRKAKGRRQFSKKSPSWGWHKFILLEDFKDSSNGYLVKTKCCIEAQVAIIGSSQME